MSETRRGAWLVCANLAVMAACEGRVETVEEAAVAESAVEGSLLETVKKGAPVEFEMKRPGEGEPPPMWRWLVSGKAYWGDSGSSELEFSDHTVRVRQIEGARRLVLDDASGAPVWSRELPGSSPVQLLRLTRKDADSPKVDGSPERPAADVLALYESGNEVIVRAFDAWSGEPGWRWSTGSSEGTSWQIGVESWPQRRLFVYAKGAEGLEVLELDPTTGTPGLPVRRDGALRALADTPWTWDGPTRDAMWKASRATQIFELEGVVFMTVRDEERREPVSYELTEDVVRLRHDEHSEDTWSAWRLDLGGTEYATAIVSGDCLVVASGSFIAAGVTLRCYDVDDGTERWKRHLYGIGPVAHSKYHNAFLLTEQEGLIRVQGDESSGDYYEWVDPKTGRSVLNVRFL